MKSLCITGAAQDDLDRLAAMLREAGMAPARGAARDPGITIAYWHEQAGQAPGRLWTQLASEIFLANMQSAVWGWADARSMGVLDFWLDFDPGLHVILACSTLEHTVARAVAADTDVARLPELARAWETQCRDLLRFQASHPRRVLLVDANACRGDGAGWLECCIEQWQLPLKSKKAATPHVPGYDAMASFLARQWIGDRPSVAALEHALKAASVPGGADAPAPDAWTGAVADYRRQRARCGAAEALAATRAVALDAAAGELQASLALRASEQAAWEQDRLALEERVRAAEDNRETAAQLEAAQHALREAELEHALVTAQLQRVQEEMHHYFDQYRTARRKWTDFLERTPAYRGYATLESVAGGRDGKVGWHITDLETARLFLPGIRFDTVFVGGAVAIVLSRATDGASPLVRWPSAAMGRDTLVIAPPPAAGAAILADLATSDWHLLRTLVRVLADVLARPAGHALPPSCPADALRAGVDRLDSVLAAWPDTLRFDRIGLKREQVNPDYEHLWLKLDNLSFAGRHWPTWEFRLACAGVGPAQFGNHPKLEFPADTGPAVLAHWFEESRDDFGAKLELRFAVPGAIDQAVWQRLAASDQAFLLALVRRLPGMLAALEQDGAAACRRPWSDWRSLAGRIQEIVAQRIPGASIDAGPPAASIDAT